MTFSQTFKLGWDPEEVARDQAEDLDIRPIARCSQRARTFQFGKKVPRSHGKRRSCGDSGNGYSSCLGCSTRSSMSWRDTDDDTSGAKGTATDARAPDAWRRRGSTLQEYTNLGSAPTGILLAAYES